MRVSRRPVSCAACPYWKTTTRDPAFRMTSHCSTDLPLFRSPALPISRPPDLPPHSSRVTDTHAKRRGLPPLEVLAALVVVLAGDAAAHGTGLDRLVEHAPALGQPVAVGRREPQAEEEPLLRRVLVIGEIGARMQRDVAVDDLEVAGLEPHRVRELRTAHHLVERFQRLPLLRRDARHA